MKDDNKADNPKKGRRRTEEEWQVERNAQAPKGSTNAEQLGAMPSSPNNATASKLKPGLRRTKDEFQAKQRVSKGRSTGEPTVGATPSENVPANKLERGLRRTEDEWQAKQRAFNGRSTGEPTAGAAPLASNSVPANKLERGLRRTEDERQAKREASEDRSTGEPTVVVPPSNNDVNAHRSAVADPCPPDVEIANDPTQNTEATATDEATVTDLAVASPVEDSSQMMHLETAEEVDPTQLKELTPEQEKTRAFKRNGLIALILVAGIVALAVAFGIDTSKDKDSAIGDSPTLAPSGAPTGAPTMAPTTLLGVSLPKATQEAVNLPFSPQAKAYEWLSNHPLIHNIPTWRKQQMFALATFFYALEGPTWPAIVKRSWMDYNVHECNWFSQEFIDEEVQYYLSEAVGANKIDATICNEDGHYTVLALSLLDLNAEQHSIVMPPEIEWLSNLGSLKIDISNVKAGLPDLLLGQEQQPILLPNITVLSLFQNNIYGYIPTKIADMQALNYLDISNNKLVFPLPSEMGTMTNLGEIYLQSNRISGHLPTELGNLGGVHRMDLSNNVLTSILPTEMNAMTSLEWLWIRHNNLEGQLTGLGALTNLIGLYLQDNSLTGPLSNLITKEWTQAHSSSMRYLHLASNKFGSSIPVEIGLMTNLQQLNLSNTGLTGRIPSELGLLNATNNQISLLGNHFDTDVDLPMELCPWICLDVTSPFAIQEFLETSLMLPAASEQCNCTLGTTYPLENVSNELVINIRFDEYPDETEWVLKKLDVSLENNTTVWTNVEAGMGVPELMGQLVSYNQRVASDTLYCFSASDAFGDGNCCNHGRGGISITNGTIASTKSEEVYNPFKGTIVWNSWELGFADYTEAYVWVDSEGRTQIVSAAEGVKSAKAAAKSGSGTY